MGLTEFTFRMIVFFIPGIIAFIIIDNLTIHRETKLHHWFVYSFLLGFLSYFPSAILVFFRGIYYGTEESIFFLQYLSDFNAVINFKEILFASIGAIAISLIVTNIVNKGKIFELAHCMKISNKLAETDIWQNLLNQYKPKWITVRNLENGLVYSGMIVSSADGIDRDGLLLQDVDVYNEEGEMLYHMKVVYLPQKMERLIIEIYSKEE